LFAYESTLRHPTSFVTLNIYCLLNRKSWKFFHKVGCLPYTASQSEWQ